MGIKAIRIVKLDDIPGAKEELKKIRKKFYSWRGDINYLNMLISQGVITADDIRKKSFRNKDLGECELIAIAKTAEDEYQIVTNDKEEIRESYIKLSRFVGKVLEQGIDLLGLEAPERM